MSAYCLLQMIRRFEASNMQTPCEMLASAASSCSFCFLIAVSASILSVMSSCVHPAAVRHRLIDDLDDAPRRRRHVLLGERPLGDLRQDLGVILLGVAAERAALLTVLQQIEQGQSRFDHLRRQAIALDKTCVDDDEP